MTIAYSYRPIALIRWSWFEFHGATELRPRATASAAAAANDDEIDAPFEYGTRGRTPNKVFQLRASCPFAGTHELRLLSKLRVPKMYPPTFSLPKEFVCETKPARVKRQKKEAAAGGAPRLLPMGAHQLFTVMEPSNAILLPSCETSPNARAPSFALVM